MKFLQFLSQYILFFFVTLKTWRQEKALTPVILLQLLRSRGLKKRLFLDSRYAGCSQIQVNGKFQNCMNNIINIKQIANKLF